MAYARKNSLDYAGLACFVYVSALVGQTTYFLLSPGTVREPSAPTRQPTGSPEQLS